MRVVAGTLAIISSIFTIYALYDLAKGWIHSEVEKEIATKTINVTSPPTAGATPPHSNNPQPPPSEMPSTAPASGSVPTSSPNPEQTAPAQNRPRNTAPVAAQQPAPVLTEPKTTPPQNMFVRLTEENAKDIWSTSVFSYAPGGGGPGGGLENDRLRVGGWGDFYVALIQFDLPNVNCSSKVMLELYNTNDSRSPTPMYLYVITSSWDWRRGDRLWWKDLPTAEPWQNRIIPAPGLNAWLSIDISDLFAKWCTNDLPNYGLMLKPVLNSNNYDTFYSTRYVGDDDLVPRLLISD
jgi:hypothetical protein